MVEVEQERECCVVGEVRACNCVFQKKNINEVFFSGERCVFYIPIAFFESSFFLKHNIHMLNVHGHIV